MAAIEVDQMSAVLGEGAAVRLGNAQNQGGDGETHVYFEPCEDTKSVTVADRFLEGTGRMLDVSMTLRNVCPGKRVAVGLALSEVDNAGGEHSRGFRAITVPAHANPTCCDVRMPSTRFILPEDLRVDGGGGMCGGRRHFVIRTGSHYVDGATTC